MLIRNLAQTSHSPVLLLAISLLFTGLFSILVTQWVNSGSLCKALSWARKHVSALILASLSAAAIPLVVTALTGTYWPGFTLGFFLCYVVAKADQVKYETALTHFIWSDFFKTSDPGKFKELIGHYIRPAFFLPMLLGQLVGNTGVFLIAGTAMLSGQATWYDRLLAAAVGLALLLLFWRVGVWIQWPVIRRFFRLESLSVFDYDQNIQSFGVWLAFLAHVTLVAVDQDRPANYSLPAAEPMRNLLKTYPLPSPSDQPALKPTILVLAVESLWDVTRIQGLDYTQDPLGAFRDDYAGDVTASCFAGLTANSEFEFLTGYSLQAMHDSACPFIKIKHALPALPAQLGKQGYRTTAIHSYTQTFYDRDRVYPLLGFDQFQGLETLTAHGQFTEKGWYMADEALLEPILNQLDATTDPQLIYTLTMQNHGPYVPPRYPDADLDPHAIPDFPSQLPTTPGDRQAVIQYTQGVLDAGKLYASLRSEIDGRPQPIVVLTFGDHLPGIGEQSGYRLMVDSGLASSVKDPALYQVPVFYHANPAAQAAGLPAKLELACDDAGHWPHFNLLGIRLLQAAGLPLEPLQQLILDLDHADPKNAPSAMKKASGESAQDLHQAFEWIQYDRLWGEGFTFYG